MSRKKFYIRIELVFQFQGERYGVCDNSLNLSVAKFCPNLRKLSVGFKSNELLETMKMIFNNCQLNIWKVLRFGVVTNF